MIFLQWFFLCMRFPLKSSLQMRAAFVGQCLFGFYLKKRIILFYWSSVKKVDTEILFFLFQKPITLRLNGRPGEVVQKRSTSPGCQTVTKPFVPMLEKRTFFHSFRETSNRVWNAVSANYRSHRCNGRWPFGRLLVFGTGGGRSVLS